MSSGFYFLFIVCFLIKPALLEESDVKNVVTPEANYFLDYLFSKYGNNGKISYEGFEHLLDSLGLGRLKFSKEHELAQHKSENGTFQEVHDILHLHTHNHSHLDGKHRSPRSAQLPAENSIDYAQNNVVHKIMKLGSKYCLTPEEMLMIYNFEPNHELGLSPKNFMHICPVLVYQLDQRSCNSVNEINGKLEVNIHDKYYVWLSATLSVFVISVVGLLGVCIVPLLQKTFFAEILSFLVALAIGTLCGDALLHLLPHALERHGEEGPNNVIYRAGVVFLSVVLFFIIEKLMDSSKDKVTEEAADLEKSKRRISIGESIVESGPMIKHSHSHATPKERNVASVAYMVIMGDGLHNLTDGLAIGAAFSGDLISGFTTAIAVFTHELPHELGDFAVLLQVGMSIKEAVYYNILSSVLSFIGMAIGLLLGNFSSASLWIYAVTAGVFLYIALANLVPEMNKPRQDGQKRFTNLFIQLAGLLSGAGIMFLIALYEHDLESLILN